MFENLISNSKGTNLIVHSKAVSKLAEMMCDRAGVSNEKKEVIKTAALLHDIGKSYKPFYDYVSTNVESEEFMVNKLLHHEISWAVLFYLLDNNITKYTILYSTYWHHAKDDQNKDKEYASSIIDKLSIEDRKRIVELYNHLMTDNKTIDVFENDVYNDEYPKYFINKDNDKISKINFLTLSCLISADRYTSMYNQEKILSDDEYCNQILNKIHFTTQYNYNIPNNYNIERFNQQLFNVQQIPNNTTTILKAPAGYGKTISGILWWIRTNRKLLWVCPRNVVAESVYNNIISELNALGLNNVKVELYLTGKIIKSNYENYNDFTSDIIVTNIDNFLNPTVNNYVRNRLFSILSFDVIFDEFHEFIANEPYFAAFVNIMNIRHNYTTSNTLLLSATPTIMNFLWDKDKKTTILPNENSHYNAVHDKKYTITFIDNIGNIIPTDDTLMSTNAISSAQYLTIKKSYTNIVHSKFIEIDKQNIVKKLYDMYGKHSTLHKSDVISAPIVKSSMDISFKNVNIIISSPENFLQIIGRVNRWGEYDNANINIIIDINNIDIRKREQSAIKITYDENLNIKWINFIKNNINQEQTYTLNQLYLLYNKFNELNNNIIQQYIRTKLRNSTNLLSFIYPKKFIIQTDETITVKKVGSKLRDNGVNKIFCIFPIHESENFTDPFYIEDNDDLISINETSVNDINKTIKKLLTDVRFDYNKYRTIKNPNFNLNKLREMAMVNDKTPYISFNKTYHSKLGLIDTKLL